MRVHWLVLLASQVISILVAISPRLVNCRRSALDDHDGNLFVDKRIPIPTSLGKNYHHHHHHQLILDGASGIVDLSSHSEKAHSQWALDRVRPEYIRSGLDQDRILIGEHQLSFYGRLDSVRIAKRNKRDVSKRNRLDSIEAILSTSTMTPIARIMGPNSTGIEHKMSTQIQAEPSKQIKMFNTQVKPYSIYSYSALQNPQSKNKKPIHASISQESVNSLLKLLLLFLVSTLGCMGTIFVMSALTVIESLQTRGNCYMVCLSMAQLLVTLLVLPSSAVKLMAGDKVIDERRLCHYQWLTLEFSLVVSQLSFMLMAAENYLGYKCSERVKTKLTGKISSEGSSNVPSPFESIANTVSHSSDPNNSNNTNVNDNSLVQDQRKQFKQKLKHHESAALLREEVSNSPIEQFSPTTYNINSEQQQQQQQHLANSEPFKGQVITQFIESYNTKSHFSNAGALWTSWIPSIINKSEKQEKHFATKTNSGHVLSGNLKRDLKREKKLSLAARFQLSQQERNIEANLIRPNLIGYRFCCGRLGVLIWIVLIWTLALAFTYHHSEFNFGYEFCTQPTMSSKNEIVPQTPKSSSTQSSASGTGSGSGSKSTSTSTLTSTSSSILRSSQSQTSNEIGYDVGSKQETNQSSIRFSSKRGLLNESPNGLALQTLPSIVSSMSTSVPDSLSTKTDLSAKVRSRRDKTDKSVDLFASSQATSTPDSSLSFEGQGRARGKEAQVEFQLKPLNVPSSARGYFGNSAELATKENLKRSDTLGDTILVDPIGSEMRPPLMMETVNKVGFEPMKGSKVTSPKNRREYEKRCKSQEHERSVIERKYSNKIHSLGDNLVPLLSHGSAYPIPSNSGVYDKHIPQQKRFKFSSDKGSLQSDLQSQAEYEKSTLTKGAFAQFVNLSNCILSSSSCVKINSTMGVKLNRIVERESAKRRTDEAKLKPMVGEKTDDKGSANVGSGERGDVIEIGPSLVKCSLCNSSIHSSNVIPRTEDEIANNISDDRAMKSNQPSRKTQSVRPKLASQLYKQTALEGELNMSDRYHRNEMPIEPDGRSLTETGTATTTTRSPVRLDINDVNLKREDVTIGTKMTVSSVVPPISSSNRRINEKTIKNSEEQDLNFESIHDGQVNRRKLLIRRDLSSVISTISSRKTNMSSSEAHSSGMNSTANPKVTMSNDDRVAQNRSSTITVLKVNEGLRQSSESSQVEFNAPTTELALTPRSKYFLLILVSSILLPSLASAILFLRAYMSMKEFKNRPYKTLPIEMLNHITLSSILTGNETIPTPVSLNFPSNSPSDLKSLNYNGNYNNDNCDTITRFASSQANKLHIEEREEEADEESDEEDDEDEDDDENVSEECSIDGSEQMLRQSENVEASVGTHCDQDPSKIVKHCMGILLKPSSHQPYERSSSQPNTSLSMTGQPVESREPISPLNRGQYKSPINNRSPSAPFNWIPNNNQQLKLFQASELVSGHPSILSRTPSERYTSSRVVPSDIGMQRDISFSAPPTAGVQPRPVWELGVPIVDLSQSANDQSMSENHEQTKQVSDWLLSPRDAHDDGSSLSPKNSSTSTHSPRLMSAIGNVNQSTRPYEFRRRQNHAQSFHYGSSFRHHYPHLSRSQRDPQAILESIRSQPVSWMVSQNVNQSLYAPRTSHHHLPQQQQHQHQEQPLPGPQGLRSPRLPRSVAEIVPRLDDQFCEPMSNGQHDIHQLERHFSLPPLSRVYHPATTLIQDTTNQRRTNPMESADIDLLNRQPIDSDTVNMALAKVVQARKGIDRKRKEQNRMHSNDQSINLRSSDQSHPDSKDKQQEERFVESIQCPTIGNLDKQRSSLTQIEAQPEPKLPVIGQTKISSKKGDNSEEPKLATLCTYSFMPDDQLLRSNIIVFFFNLILWLPFLLTWIADQYGRNLSFELKNTVWWIATLNCCSSSYVYAITNKDFREAFSKLFYYFCCKSHVTFARKTPIFRRQLDMDSNGNLRIHIIPGLNLYSNKLSKGGDPVMSPTTHVPSNHVFNGISFKDARLQTGHSPGPEHLGLGTGGYRSHSSTTMGLGHLPLAWHHHNYRSHHQDGQADAGNSYMKHQQNITSKHQRNTANAFDNNYQTRTSKTHNQAAKSTSHYRSQTSHLRSSRIQRELGNYSYTGAHRSHHMSTGGGFGGPLFANPGRFFGGHSHQQQEQQDGHSSRIFGRSSERIRSNNNQSTLRRHQINEL